jgi:hypothetical protein
MVKKLGVLVVLLLCVSFASAAEDYCDTFFDTPEKIGAANNLCAKRLTSVYGAEVITGDFKEFTCYGIYKGIPLTDFNSYIGYYYESFGNPFVEKDNVCPSTLGNFNSAVFNSPGDKSTLTKCIDDSNGEWFGKLYKADCKTSDPECSDTKACADGKTCTAGKCVGPLCIEDEKRCSDDNLQQCMKSSTTQLLIWSNQASCENGCQDGKCVVKSITKSDGDFDGDGKIDKADKVSIKAKVKEFVSYIKSLKGKDSLGKEIHKYLRKIK